MDLDEFERRVDYQRIKSQQEKICAYADTYNNQYVSALVWAW